MNFHEIPCAHVRRFFLHPERGRVGAVGLQRAVERGVAQRIELLDANDGDVITLGFFAMFEEVVIDFTCAEQDAFNGIGGGSGVR